MPIFRRENGSLAAVPGNYVIFDQNGIVTLPLTGGSTYFGFEAGNVEDLADRHNVGIGHRVLYNNTIGGFNSAVGYRALYNNIDGHYNTAMGKEALYSNSSGQRNIAIGFYAGKYEVGSNAFYVNNRDWTTNANERLQSIIYGQMAAIVADQKLTFNAEVKINGKCGLNNTAPVGQAAHIADPTDLDTAITAIKAILVVLENLGAVATA